MPGSAGRTCHHGVRLKISMLWRSSTRDRAPSQRGDWILSFRERQRIFSNASNSAPMDGYSMRRLWFSESGSFQTTPSVNCASRDSVGLDKTEFNDQRQVHGHAL